MPSPSRTPADHDLLRASASDLLALYAAKRLSPVETTTAVLQAIDAINPVINAYCYVADDALVRAKASEARWMKDEPCGPLDGVPISIKDILLTNGWPTRRGSKTIDAAGPWLDDAPSVARLRESGAILIGKTTTPEFGWKGVTDSPLTGITRNPWDLSKTPGGSSGGGAAALAAGLGPLTIGTDGGGSIRIPCAFTGVYGLKPTFGRVAAWPPSPFGTLATVGPMGRSVRDVALLLNVISQPDIRDWYALPPAHADHLDRLDEGVRGWRVAYSPDLGFAQIDPEVAAIASTAARRFADLGAYVEEVTPRLDDVAETFRRHWFSAAAFLVRDFTPAQKAMMDPGLVDLAAQGARITTLELIEAMQKRAAIGIEMNRFHEKYDLLLTPALPLTAFEAGKEVANVMRERRWTDWTPFTYPFNLTQQPAASIPCGFTRDRLPVGLQIVGPRFKDAEVLRASRAFETVHPIVLPELAKIAAQPATPKPRNAAAGA